MSTFEMVETLTQGTIIKVVGVGGAGGNAIQHMINRGVKGVEFICANTDAQALAKSNADRVIQLGSSGLGAGAKPEAGRAAAEQDRDRIRETLMGAHMVFITAGMGGGTGTGAAPVVAEIAKELGALTVAVVTKPFGFEGARRRKAADEGLAELEGRVDSLIIILNEKLEEVLDEDVTQIEAFEAADDVLNSAVAGIAEIINVDGMVNVDFQDVKTVMSEHGKAMMGTATASGPDRARIAAEQAVRSPLLEGVDLSGARGVLVNITASAGLKLKETKIAMETVRTFAAEDATIIYGSVLDDSMGDAMRVTVVATGLGQARRKPSLVANQPSMVTDAVGSQPYARTGTHDALPGMTLASQPQAPIRAQQPNSPGVPRAPLSRLDDEADIWRPARVDAAAKVALMEASGMETLDIPAFIRRQAD